jgi:PTS system mannose-specific IIC component
MTLLLLLLLGGWVALDGAALGQFLLSRPLVAASIAGLLVGDPLSGLLVGLLLELAHLVHLPLGGARLPEPGPGAVAAGAVAGLVGGGTGLILGFTLGLGLGWLGGKSVVWHRQVTGAVLTRAALAGGGLQLGRSLVGSLVRDGLRGVGLVGLGLATFHAIPAGWLVQMTASWPMSMGWTVLVLVLALLPGLGQLAHIAEPEPRRRLTLFMSGLGVGAVLALSLGAASFLTGAG